MLMTNLLNRLKVKSDSTKRTPMPKPRAVSRTNQKSESPQTNLGSLTSRKPSASHCSTAYIDISKKKHSDDQSSVTTRLTMFESRNLASGSKANFSQDEYDDSRQFILCSKTKSYEEQNQFLKLKCMHLEERLRDEIQKRQKAESDKDYIRNLIMNLETKVNYLIEENERLNSKLMEQV